MQAAPKCQVHVLSRAALRDYWWGGQAGRRTQGRREHSHTCLLTYHTHVLQATTWLCTHVSHDHTLMHSMSRDRAQTLTGAHALVSDTHACSSTRVHSRTRLCTLRLALGTWDGGREGAAETGGAGGPPAASGAHRPFARPPRLRGRRGPAVRLGSGPFHLGAPGRGCRWGGGGGVAWGPAPGQRGRGPLLPGGWAGAGTLGPEPAEGRGEGGPTLTSWPAQAASHAHTPARTPSRPRRAVPRLQGGVCMRA